MKDIPTVPPWALLDEVVAFVRKYTVLTDAQAEVIGLWIFHTHVFEVSETTPYLAVTSAEKQSGKTRLLEVLELVVRRAWLVQGASDAALFRKIADTPTLLFDEIDAVFAKDAKYYQDTRALLNSGYRKSGKISRCDVQGKNVKVKDFSSFCPKALAGIGALPDTIADRSIHIRMTRRRKGETVHRFRLRKAGAEGRTLRGKVEEWACGAMAHLENAEPVQPDGLSDRMEDACEPLLAIADLLGGIWPEKARRALVDLCRADDAKDVSRGVTLLQDIRGIFDWKGHARLASSEIVECLKGIEESPWASWNHGKGFTPSDLSRELRPYRVGPKNMRIAGAVVKGYDLDAFEDAFSRLLPDAVAVKQDEAALVVPF